ncbi:Rieske (2Fe-2S) protein [Nocardia cyriacigeorgica]|uniref:DUF5914 domain-containing protein n=1 Tax=Nocardia cyriacigeorgica TaxID=135487 RepID=UPI001895930D|nr:DUF5914 domain-containing protein [Nocardia cyriacigeorgica]MBF6097660.1 Rieske (2Fe-2S) protein [Nocardia cyriacigeorgica]MBF6161696.1 Rieske (2Fe-2S) protein [Nocardia cyriacigeorgica]MBF6200494.1 Rieske (2Fe-2S) protein [Nocardia cyriacigeorgica]MBF6512996.1 Rieske (2Fe-2S) protein [Nocardia cyriacigeorgica]
MNNLLFRRWPDRWPLQPLDVGDWIDQPPTYHAAKPALIAAILRRAQQRPSGNWYVFAASRDIRTDRPFGFTIAGVELVAWRDRRQRLAVGPGACPHMGAPMAQAHIDCGALVCRWHGLRLDNSGVPGWTPLPCHDDGVLVWVRLDHIGGGSPLETPVLGARPPAHRAIAAVATLSGVCEPDDVVANRLDPWHGAWFHPYSFAHLEVLASPPLHRDSTDFDDRFLVAVTFRVGRRLGVPVTAEFTSPEPRTVTMRIIDGEGVGSVVETHATPLGPGPDGLPRTAVIEAVIADSTRPGFARARRLTRLLRPMMAHTAARLWDDDLAYAERRYHQRTQEPRPLDRTKRPTAALSKDRSHKAE